MSDSLFPPTSLLAATAAQPSSARREETAPGFADEFAAATDSAQSGVTASDSPPADDRATPINGQAETSAASDETASNSSDSDPNTEPTTESDVGHSETSSDELLAVTVAYETIVSETAPTAQLPVEATTTVEVHAAATSELIEESIEPVGDALDETPGETAIEPQLALEATSEADFDAELAQTVKAATDSPASESAGPGVADNEPIAAINKPSETSRSVGPAAATAVEESLKTPETIPLDTAAEAETSAATDEEAQPSTSTATRQSTVATTTANTAVATPADSDVESQDTSPAPRVDPLGTTTERTTPQAERAETAAPTQREAPPAVDPARFVSRVTRAFDLASQRGGGPIEMRLSPPELGSLQLRLELREGVLTASMETETQAARNALLDNLPALRDRLAEQQIRVEKFDVDVRDELQQSGEQRTGNEGDRSTRDRDGDEPRRASSQQDTPLNESAASRAAPASIVGSEAINVVA